MDKLNATETAIVAAAVTLLSRWSWNRDGEPLGALTAASKLLFDGVEMHTALANISRAERLYAPSDAAWNNVEVRLRALRAVLRFCCACPAGAK